MSIVLRSGSATDKGRVRTNNQDCILEDHGIYAVADGMGGHAGGEVAARTAVDAVRSEFAGTDGDPPASLLARSIQAANKAVWTKAGSDKNLRGMGTTMVGLAVAREPAGDRLVIANVGDSRAYVLKNRNLVKITTDHTIVEAKVLSGELTAEEAVNHPHRHILTRALGTEPNVSVDAWQMQPVPGDRYLLCSDGLFNEVSDAEIAALLQRTADPAAASTQLVELARAHGGSDNISVVVVDVVEAVGPASPGTLAPHAEQVADRSSRDESAGEKPPGSGAPPSSGIGSTAAGMAGGLAGGAFGAAMMGMARGSATASEAFVPPGSPVPNIPTPSKPEAEKASSPAPTPVNSGESEPAQTLADSGESAVPKAGADPPGPDPDIGSDPFKGGDGVDVRAFSSPQVEVEVSSQTSVNSKAKGPADVTASPAGMSDVLSDLLRAADSPDWQGLTTAVPPIPGSSSGSGSGDTVDATVASRSPRIRGRHRSARSRDDRLGPEDPMDARQLDLLFSASERAGALREAEKREALREAIRFSEAKGSGFGHGLFDFRSHPTEDAHFAPADDPLLPSAPMFTWRVLGFLVLLGIVVMGSIASVVWFADNSYYVGFDGQHLAVYQGRPGGLAWFQPHLVHETSVRPSQVLPSRLPDIRSGVIEPSKGAALGYISNLTAEKLFASQGGASPPAAPPPASITSSAP